MWVLCPFRRMSNSESYGSCLCCTISPVSLSFTSPPSYKTCTRVLKCTEHALLSSCIMAVFQEDCDGTCCPENFLMAPLLHKLQTSMEIPDSLCMRNKMLRWTPFMFYGNSFSLEIVSMHGPCSSGHSLCWVLNIKLAAQRASKSKSWDWEKVREEIEVK